MGKLIFAGAGLGFVLGWLNCMLTDRVRRRDDAERELRHRERSLEA